MDLREALAEEIYAATGALKIDRKLIEPLVARGVTSKIAPELYKVFEKHGADRIILGTLGSWGDNADDEATLGWLKTWNADLRAYRRRGGGRLGLRPRFEKVAGRSDRLRDH